MLRVVFKQSVCLTVTQASLPVACHICTGCHDGAMAGADARAATKLAYFGLTGLPKECFHDDVRLNSLLLLFPILHTQLGPLHQPYRRTLLRQLIVAVNQIAPIRTTLPLCSIPRCLQSHRRLAPRRRQRVVSSGLLPLVVPIRA